MKNKISVMQGKTDFDEKKADNQKYKRKMTMLNNAIFWKDPQNTVSSKINMLMEKKQQAIFDEVMALPRKAIKHLISLVEKVPNALVIGILINRIKPVAGTEYYFQSGFNSLNKFLWNTTQTNYSAYDEETLKVCLTQPINASKAIRTVLNVCKNGYIQALQGSNEDSTTDPTLGCISDRYSCHFGLDGWAIGIIIAVLLPAAIGLFCYCCCKKVAVPTGNGEYEMQYRLAFDSHSR
jgi:hypothetical protein